MKTRSTLYYLPVALIVFYTVSCKKDNVPVNVAMILENHSWYFYKADINLMDTLTVTYLDSNLIKTLVKTSTRNLDTTIMTGGCLENSFYQFKANGSLSITTPCSVNNFLNDTTWFLNQNNILSFSIINNPSIEKYSNNYSYNSFPLDTTFSIYATNGYIAKIDDSHMVINGYTTINSDRYLIGVDSNYKSRINISTEYRSK